MPDRFTKDDAPPRPSSDLMARMMAAHKDPVLMAGLHEEYRREIAAAGYDPDKLRPFNEDHGPAPIESAPRFTPAVQTRSRGQGPDFALPPSDRD